MCFIETPYDTSHIGVSGKPQSECKMCFIETIDKGLPSGVSEKHQAGMLDVLMETPYDTSHIGVSEKTPM